MLMESPIQQKSRANIGLQAKLRFNGVSQASLSGPVNWQAQRDPLLYVYRFLSCLQVLEYFNKQCRLDVDNERTRHDFYCCKYIKMKYDEALMSQTSEHRTSSNITTNSECTLRI